jgi:hypothetical protein
MWSYVGLSLLSSVSKYNVWLYYGWVVVFVFVSKDNTWSYYGWVYFCCRSSVDTICGGIMVGFVDVVVHQ